jgi:hypothetical protein
MAFRPNVGDELTLNGVTYRIAEHPAAPGIPYGQEGRAGIVYCLERSPLPSGELSITHKCLGDCRACRASIARLPRCQQGGEILAR